MSPWSANVRAQTESNLINQWVYDVLLKAENNLLVGWIYQTFSKSSKGILTIIVIDKVSSVNEVFVGNCELVM